MHQIEGIQERGRDRHGAVEARATFLFALKRQDGRREIDPIGRQVPGPPRDDSPYAATSSNRCGPPEGPLRRRCGRRHAPTP